MATLLTKKRAAYAIATLVVFIAILSFVLPYTGLHHAGFAPVP